MQGRRTGYDAATIAYINRRLRQGISARQVAAELTARGVPISHERVRQFGTDVLRRQGRTRT